jgi:3-methyl-2-oxobutanoate hydroxymethyltransferase
MRRVTDFARWRAEGLPITMLTCYDACSARLLARTSVDAVLVGDSVAMVVHGHDSTLHATVGMIATHTAAVRRGLGPERLLVADVPFPAHRLGIAGAMRAVDRLLKAGAQAVKIEGARGHLDTIAHIVGSGVPVMGHLGLTPQSVHQFGGYKVQARDAAAAGQLLEDARALQAAGCFAIVLECIPAPLAAQVTAELAIPTIGIGSGVDCSGQILVLQDMLGLQTDFHPRFVRAYEAGAERWQGALEHYCEDVRGRRFPAAEESFG